MAENTIWQEQFRLLKLARETPAERLLDEALAGRERTAESVAKLLTFVVRVFGQEGLYPGRPDLDSIVTKRIGDACSEFLSEAGVEKEQIDAIRYPAPRPGTKEFVSVLEEFE
jgi:hypothetical protein